MRLKSKRKQYGLTLVELMIGITVSMLVITGAIAVYLTSIRGSNDTLRLARLNQETRSLFAIMTSELRRTGYCAPDPSQPTICLRAPPTQDVFISDDGECVLYYYEREADLTATNVLGFRLAEDGTIEMLPEGSLTDTSITDSCDKDDGWFTISDPKSISITTLEFDRSSSQCMDLSDDSVSDGPCPSPVSGAKYYEMRRMSIRLVGNDSKDPSTAIDLTENVTFRNSRVLIEP